LTRLVRQPLPPTPALELTPQSGPKIGAILTAGFRLIAFPVYQGGAAQRQAVMRQNHELVQGEDDDYE
jgi:hypothetical protein